MKRSLLIVFVVMGLLLMVGTAMAQDIEVVEVFVHNTNVDIS